MIAKANERDDEFSEENLIRMIKESPYFFEVDEPESQSREHMEEYLDRRFGKPFWEGLREDLAYFKSLVLGNNAEYDAVRT